MRIAIYTAITNDKDSLKEVSAHVHAGVDRIIFTDQPGDHVGVHWDVRPACDLFTNPQRNTRAHKILAHQYLVDYDYSLWIDGSIRLHISPRILVDSFLRDADVAMFPHPTRTCLYAEATVCAELGHEKSQILAEQMARYRQASHPEHYGLNECAVILRRHNAATELFNNAWWSEYCRHSCRDQVSLPYVLRLLGVRLALLPGTIHDNPGLVSITGHTHYDPITGGSR